MGLRRPPHRSRDRRAIPCALDCYQVRDLLAIDNETTLAQASTWADEIRPQRPETSRWHYVNIPINPPAGTPPAYDARRDCPTGDCVVAKIGAFEAVLRDKAAPPRQRLEALKWLVHLVADINQPLHCADNRRHMLIGPLI